MRTQVRQRGEDEPRVALVIDDVAVADPWTPRFLRFMARTREGPAFAGSAHAAHTERRRRPEGRIDLGVAAVPAQDR